MVSAAIVLKALNLLPHPVPREELADRLRLVFGEEYASEDGSISSPEELISLLESRGDLVPREDGLAVSPDWGCRKDPAQPD